VPKAAAPLTASGIKAHKIADGQFA